MRPTVSSKKVIQKVQRSFTSSCNVGSGKTFNGYWMPFTDHDRFNSKPKVFERAKGKYYYAEGNKEILDGMSGLWCVNAGHGHPKIVEAIKKQAETLDFVPGFSTAHRGAPALSQKLIELLPGRNFRDVFYTMCGSTAVDSAMKMALQYWRSKGEAGRVRFIGRERAYHGVGFGGISIGGIMANRKHYASNSLPWVDHLPHTHSLPDMAFSKGSPTWGLHLADELDRILTFHDPSTVAAVFIEPVAGSTGVLPPPQGYLQRIREICTKHNVLLVFDEVITGFGRIGASFGTVKFDVTPDIITCAKGLTNAAVPAGAVICQSHIFDAIHEGAHKNPGMQVEFFHGYTYSGHPLAMAAGIATMEVYKEEKLFERAAALAPYWENILHQLKGLPHVIDIRNYGLMGAVEIAAVPGFPAKRALDIFDRCFEMGLLVRVSGTTVAMSPPLILEKADLDRIVDTLSRAIKDSAAQLK